MCQNNLNWPVLLAGTNFRDPSICLLYLLSSILSLKHDVKLIPRAKRKIGNRGTFNNISVQLLHIIMNLLIEICEYSFENNVNITVYIFH